MAPWPPRLNDTCRMCRLSGGASSLSQAPLAPQLDAGAIVDRPREKDAPPPARSRSCAYAPAALPRHPLQTAAPPTPAVRRARRKETLRYTNEPYALTHPTPCSVAAHTCEKTCLGADEFPIMLRRSPGYHHRRGPHADCPARTCRLFCLCAWPRVDLGLDTDAAEARCGASRCAGQIPEGSGVGGRLIGRRMRQRYFVTSNVTLPNSFLTSAALVSVTQLSARSQAW